MMASFSVNAYVLPETPVPFKSGTGAIDNDTVYIMLLAVLTRISSMAILKILTKLEKIQHTERRRTGRRHHEAVISVGG